MFHYSKLSPLSGITSLSISGSLIIPCFLQLFTHSTASIVASFSLFLLSVMSWPALLKTLSISADVAGMANTSNTIRDKSGKWAFCPIHQALTSLMVISQGVCWYVVYSSLGPILL